MSDAFERYYGLDVFKEPQCLLKTDEEDHLKIEQGTAKQLQEITLPVNVVTIVGLYRTGKSYLMNRLAGETSGFALGNTVQSKTKGIWVWCKKHPKKEGEVLMLLDTEGLGDVEKGNQDHDNEIFIIAALLSSTLVFNIMCAFNQDTVGKLTFITKMSEHLRLSSKDSSDDNFDFVMPEFVLCIRDFTLNLEIDGKKCSEDEYLEHSLREKKPDGKTKIEEYNKPRHCIKKYFTKRKVFTFDRPASRRLLENLDSAREENLSPDFNEETKRFISYIHERHHKMLHNMRPISGEMLVELLRSFIAAMKGGAVICVEDSLTVLSAYQNEKRKKDAIVKFNAMLKAIEGPVKNKCDLLRQMYEFQTSVLARLISELLFDDDHAVEDSAKTEMEMLFKEFERKNDQQVYEICMKGITDMYNENVKRSNAYLISGGYEKYRKDMERTMDKAENDLIKENIDSLQINRAKQDFQVGRLQERVEIMAADKSISEQEKKDQERKLKAELKQSLENERKKMETYLERQNTKHQEEMSKLREKQEEQEKKNKDEFERIIKNARRDEIDQLKREVEQLQTRLKEKEDGICLVM